MAAATLGQTPPKSILASGSAQGGALRGAGRRARQPTAFPIIRSSGVRTSVTGARRFLC